MLADVRRVGIEYGRDGLGEGVQLGARRLPDVPRGLVDPRTAGPQNSGSCPYAARLPPWADASRSKSRLTSAKSFTLCTPSSLATSSARARMPVDDLGWVLGFDRREVLGIQAASTNDRSSCRECVLRSGHEAWPALRRGLRRSRPPDQLTAGVTAMRPPQAQRLGAVSRARKQQGNRSGALRLRSRACSAVDAGTSRPRSALLGDDAAESLAGAGRIRRDPIDRRHRSSHWVGGVGDHRSSAWPPHHPVSRAPIRARRSDYHR